MWVIQLEEEFESSKDVIEAQKKMRELTGYLGGRIVRPTDHYRIGPWKLQAFFDDNTCIVASSTRMPDELSQVYIPECLEAHFGIKK